MTRGLAFAKQTVRSESRDWFSNLADDPQPHDNVWDTLTESDASSVRQLRLTVRLKDRSLIPDFLRENFYRM
jgi:hypothetical protein